MLVTNRFQFSVTRLVINTLVTRRPYGHTANQTYDAAYKQRLNENKTHVEYQGNAAPYGHTANQTYDAAYKQRLNENKTHVEYQGNAAPYGHTANQTYDAAYKQRPQL